MKTLSFGLALLLALPGSGVGWQQPAPTGLNIVIVEGEGAINNIKLRTAREPIVEVDDENHKPIAGAIILFTLPDHGASGLFSNGARTLSVTTDAQGRAAASGLTPNSTPGNFQIQVNASYQGRTAQATIHQRNVKGGLSTPAKIAIVSAIIAAGIIAGVVASRGGSNKSTSTATATPPTVITPGSGTVGGPH